MKRKLLQGLRLAGAALGALVLLALGIGLALPREHRAARSAVYPQPPEALWAVVGDLAAVPEWLPTVEKMERLPDPAGRELWRETNRWGRQTWEIVERQPPRRLVLRLADDAPYGGTWTYAIDPAGERRSRLTITEEGWVSNPLLRFVARYLVGYTGTMEVYLEALERRLGEN